VTPTQAQFDPAHGWGIGIPLEAWTPGLVQLRLSLDPQLCLVDAAIFETRSFRSLRRTLRSLGQTHLLLGTEMLLCDVRPGPLTRRLDGWSAQFKFRSSTGPYLPLRVEWETL
jgi:hypothetical protein